MKSPGLLLLLLLSSLEGLPRLFIGFSLTTPPPRAHLRTSQTSNYGVLTCCPITLDSSQGHPPSPLPPLGLHQWPTMATSSPSPSQFYSYGQSPATGSLDHSSLFHRLPEAIRPLVGRRPVHDCHEWKMVSSTLPKPYAQARTRHRFTP